MYFCNMILPIVAYGAQVLRTKGKVIQADYPQLDKLIEDMWETMYESSGVGLAAPQVNRPIRLFVIDSTQIFTNLEDEEQGKYPDAPA
jgi:peptide deformylase